MLMDIYGVINRGGRNETNNKDTDNTNRGAISNGGIFKMKKVKITIEGIVEEESEFVLDWLMKTIRGEEWVTEVRTKVRRLIPKNSIKVEEYEEI